MNKILIIIVSLSLPLFAIANEGFSTLEEQMSGNEFNASGLNKLTPQELQVLNNWLSRHSVATLVQPKDEIHPVTNSVEEDERGFKKEEKSKMDRVPITSRLKGSFSGWNGSTIFALENGMIWEQDDKDNFYIKEVQNPEVTIDPGMFGKWRLSVKGHKSKCRVRRVQ